MKKLSTHNGYYGDVFNSNIIHVIHILFMLFFYYRTGVDPELPQNEHYITQFVNGLIVELESKAASMDVPDMFITKMKLMDTANVFKVKMS